MEVRALPYVDIQHDALTVFDDVEQGIVKSEDIWISGYKAGSSSVHGKAKVSYIEGGGAEVVSRNGVQLTRHSKTYFTVTISSLGIRDLPVKFPRQVIHPPYKKASAISAPLHINSISLSSSSPHLAIGGPDGYCAVLPISPDARPNEKVDLKGHVGDVLDVQYFPSGEVVLTSSADLSIRIWSSKDGINPRTLKGHTRGITSLGIIGVGRQVISGGNDGSVRLWDVGAAKEVCKWETAGKKAVQKVIVVDDPDSIRELGLEAGSTGIERVVLVATQTGLEVFPLTSTSTGGTKDGEEEVQTRRIDWGVDSNLVSMAYSSHLRILATGHTNGIITLRHLSRLNSPPLLIRRNEASVYSLYFSGNEGDLYVGTAAGLPCRLGVELGDGEEREIRVEVKEELAGWEAVGVESFTGGGREGIWCAGGEGGIRRY